MGLLDLFNSDDGRLGIGLLAAAGPRADGAGFGQRLQEAMTGFASQKDADMKRKLSDLLLQKTGLELDAEKLKLTDAAKARQVLMGYGLPTDAPNRAGPAPGMGAGLPAEVMAGLPPELRTPVLSAMPNASNAAAAPQKSDFFSHYMGLADKYRQAGLPDQYASALATAEKFRPKYSTTPQQMVVNGKLTNVLLAEDGSAKTLDGFDVKPDMVEQDLGGVKQWLDKNALRPNQTFAKTQSPDNVATVNATLLGQKLTDARTRSEGNANRAQSQAHFVATQANAGNSYDAERGMVVNTRSGTASPVMLNGQPLGAKDKAMTDAQAKANLFGTRADASNAILGTMAQAGVEQPGMIKRMAAATPLVGEGLATASNWTQSAPQQQVEQAQRDFVNAVLRRESGAVISPDEFNNARQQYFPQPGDSAAVIKQKTANRKTAIDGILAEVPAAYRGKTAAAPAAPIDIHKAAEAILKGGN